MKTGLRLGFLLSAALALSCGGSKMSGAASSGSKDNSLSASAQPSGDAREDVKKALQHLHDAKSFRSRTEANGMALMEVEFVNPDRFHWKAQSSEGGGEFVVIGKDTFVRKGDSLWMKSPVGMGAMSAMILQLRDADIEEAMTQREEIKFVGPDVLEGAPMFLYQYKYKPTDKLWKMWIGASDWLPHKSEGESEPSGASQVKTTVIWSDYNSDIKIEPPI